MRLAREEDGFTLVEMLVTIMVMIVVMFALYSIFDMSIRVFTYGNNKVEAVENARLGLGKMERELRAAYPYDKGNPTPDTRLFTGTLSENQITFANDLNGDRVVAPTTEQITYYLDGKTLRRTVGTGGATGGQPVVEFVKPDGPAAGYDGGLKFDYLKKSGTALVATTDEAEVEVIRISLDVQLDVQTGGGTGTATQQITTDVDLRSRN
jgi:prepilin-type N-terminal cleavage/methylation domain-containing protein